MPAHDYVCPGCGREEERWVSLHDLDRPVECLACGAQMRRVYRACRVAVRVPFWVDVPDCVVKKLERSTESRSAKVKLNLGRFGKKQK